MLFCLLFVIITVSDDVIWFNNVLHSIINARVSDIDLLDKDGVASTSDGAGKDSQRVLQIGGGAPRSESHGVHNLDNVAIEKFVREGRACHFVMSPNIAGIVTDVIT